ncbi:hypothetical protein [Nocardioides jishulii]|uniref:Uncharacterized protein n=1 Tax=Nocardioides jishulii TaxID=2575440 RepID=A0A4U2YSP8_9ACTN|nr:hypothetical protein [Nocardioides jishulii]QCX28551.1 hypothetical protein FCL41_14185 [Nocardioides jishulii]TKI64556.1 hypothetical protein FC770_05390 [Nocardioides jishulii]
MSEKDSSAVEPDWKKRRRLAEIFGDVLPATTSDERDPDSRAATKESASEAWLKRQVPPHHGGH